MPLRLVEATVAEKQLGQIPELIQDLDVVQSWTVPLGEGKGLFRALVKVEDSEPLSDRLVGRFGSQEGFRVLLLSVEATLPAVEVQPDPEPEVAGVGDPPRPGPKRVSREELYEDVTQASRLSPVYLAMVAVSSLVAAVGLIRGDVAIIIGAMVIAPLLGPNVALALASTLGDTSLAKRSLRALGAGVVTAATVSVLLGMIFTVDPGAPELAARTNAGLGDFVIALSAGTAGSLAFTSGVPSVVVGVMVAVALLPPLVAAGILAGAGDFHGALGALLLLVTNITCVNLAAVAAFLAQRVRPRTWWEANRAKKATRIAVTTWVAMSAVLLGLIWFRRIRGL